MYLEFFILFIDYFRTLKLRLFFYEIFIPFLISIFAFYLLLTGKDTSICKGFRESSLTLLGILLGFSITIIMIITTGNSENLALIKKKVTKLTIGNKKVTLFDLLLINFTYSVVIEIMLIIILLICPILLANIPFPHIIKIIGFSCLSGMIIHVLLLTTRNLTDFYLILMKK